jgi:uridylate kinase
MAKNNVDGVYDSDPNENPDAVRFGTLDYMDALSRRLDVMDSTALSLCMDNQLPIVVFNVFEPGTMANILNGQTVGTLINGRD